MRRALGPILVAILALAACRAPVSTTPSRSGTPRVTETPTVLATGSKGVPASSTPAASATPGKPADPLLHEPRGDFHRLRGAITLDTSYLLSSGLGALISNNGSTVVVPGGGQLVTAGSSGSLISNNGGAIISDNGGGLLVDGGGGLLAGASGNAIPLDADARTGGEALAASNGSFLAAGALVSNNGSGIVGKTKYRTLQATDATPRVAAGMRVSAVSLRTHQYVPLGVDAAGQPVYSIYSNLKGEYEVYLPTAEEGNVVLVAGVPGSEDARLVYNAFTPAQTAAAVPMDEDTAAATRTVRQVFTRHMIDLLTNPDVDGFIAALGVKPRTSSKELDKQVKAALLLLKDYAREKGVPNGPGADQIPEVQELAQLLTDAELSFVPYDQLMTNPLLTPGWDGPDEQVYEGLGKSFAAMRKGAARFLAANSPAVARFSLDMRLDARDDAPACEQPVELPLVYPTDLTDFLVDQILSVPMAHPIINTRYMLESISVPAIAPGTGLTYTPGNPNYYDDPADGKRRMYSSRVNACSTALINMIVLTVFPLEGTVDGQATAASRQIQQLIDDYCATHTFGPAPPVTVGGPSCTPWTPKPSPTPKPRKSPKVK
jgi:hypothetical protein